MRRRILGALVLLALVVLIALEVPLGVIGTRHLHDVAVTQDERVATGIAVAAGEAFDRGQVAELRTVADRFRARTAGEVEILGPDGRVLANADDDGDNDSLGPGRGFVQQATQHTIAGGMVSDEGEPTVMAAVPIGDGNGPAGVVLLSTSGSNTEDRIHLLEGGLAAFAVLVLAVTLGLGLVLARAVTRPLDDLGRQVRAFGDRDLDARGDEGAGPPEIAELASRFNRMADRISDLLAAQSRFVADASHQLRSPLAALRLRLENLAVTANRENDTSLLALDAEVERLSRLVDGLVSLGHAEGASPTPGEVDVALVVRDRSAAWSPLAAENDIELTCQCPAEPLPARLVEGDLDQILDNLLANAVDVSGPGTRIRLLLEGDTIQVADEGPGLSDEDLARAFDRFWQGPDRHAQGGLGLSIVEQLARRNHLDVRLQRGPEHGLVAIVDLHSHHSHT